MDNEMWKDVKGFEEYYQISNLGKVRSRDRKVNARYGLILKKGKLLKQHPNSKGYLRVFLVKDGKKPMKFVHRLVAEAFCFKSNGCNIVNHLDSNCLNNCSSNLEWTTQKGNMQHALKKGRLKKTIEQLKHEREVMKKYDKPVIGENIKTREIIKFDSINEAGRNGFTSSSVCKCCKEERNSHKGYTWWYAEDY